MGFFMAASFAVSILFTLANEGSVYRDVDQPTKFGIIAADIALYRGIPESQVQVSDIEDLTQDEAEAIYEKLFWEPQQLDELIDQGIATAIFDTGVNRGLTIGTLYAQRTVKSLGHRLEIDGVMGPQTLALINLCDENKFITNYEILAEMGYRAIVRKHPEDKIYLEGWIARAKRLLSLIQAPPKKGSKIRDVVSSPRILGR